MAKSSKLGTAKAGWGLQWICYHGVLIPRQAVWKVQNFLKENNSYLEWKIALFTPKSSVIPFQEDEEEEHLLSF